jgi:hypothetical protein
MTSHPSSIYFAAANFPKLPNPIIKTVFFEDFTQIISPERTKKSVSHPGQ